MEKNWLIRTKNNHILGPISKQKVRELLEKGSIKGDDELCSGNGYWFFVREKELVEKYVLGDIGQQFNPVTEAQTVLAAQNINENLSHEETALPNADDLEFPEQELSNTKMPEDDDLAYPEPVVDEIEAEGSTIDEMRDKISLTEKKKIISKVKKPKHRGDQSQSLQHSEESINMGKKSKSILNPNLIQILALLFFVIALVAFYFRKRIISEVINSKISIMQPVYAQVIPDSVKKNFSILPL